jgi:acyl carrier protein
MYINGARHAPQGGRLELGSELTINEKIAAKIMQVLTEVFNDGTLAEDIRPDADLVEEYGLDSLQTISFLLKTEDIFDIQLDFENLSLDDMRSVQLFSSYVARVIDKSAQL